MNLPLKEANASEFPSQGNARFGQGLSQRISGLKLVH
jgi:hypothetical protein